MSADDDRVTRRRYLTTAGVLGTLGVTGCTGGGGSDQPTSSPSQESTATSTASETPTATDTQTETASPTEEAEASIEVVEMSLPEQVEVGHEFTLEVTVENTGGATGTWNETLSAKLGGNDWVKLEELSLEVPSGETKTFTNTRSILYQSNVTYRLERAGVEASTSAVPGTFSYGETFTTVEGMEVTITGVELKPYYEYQNYDGETAQERAGDGKQWAFVNITARNINDEPVFTPLETDVSIIAGDTQYDLVYVNKEEGAFDGDEINAGITRKGWIAYKIPADLTKQDFRVTWSDDNYYGNWTVNWTASGNA